MALVAAFFQDNFVINPWILECIGFFKEEKHSASQE